MKRYVMVLALLALPLVAAYSAGGFSVSFSLALSAEESKAMAHSLGAPAKAVSQEDVAAYLREETRQFVGRRLREYQQFCAANAPVSDVVNVLEVAKPALKIEALPEKIVVEPVEEPVGELEEPK